MAELVIRLGLDVGNGALALLETRLRRHWYWSCGGLGMVAVARGSGEADGGWYLRASEIPRCRVRLAGGGWNWTVSVIFFFCRQGTGQLWLCSFRA
jgi:hypothetical protein